MQSLFERHRPRTWDDLIGHTQVKRAVTAMKDRGSLGGRAFLITGASGIGKTSAAYLIAGDVCDPENFVEIDAGELTPARLDDLADPGSQRVLVIEASAAFASGLAEMMGSRNMAEKSRELGVKRATVQNAARLWRERLGLHNTIFARGHEASENSRKARREVIARQQPTKE